MRKLREGQPQPQKQPVQQPQLAAQQQVAMQRPQPQMQQPLQPQMQQFRPASGRTGGSISDMLKHVEQRTVAAAQQQQLFEVQPDVKPIDQTKLTEVWRTFANNLPPMEARMQSHMDVEPIANGSEVKVMVRSQMQAQSLATNENLIGFLKQQLANPLLTINAIVDVQAAKEVKVVYTIEQRMNYFTEKNSVFRTFVDKYKLEPAF